MHLTKEQIKRLENQIKEIAIFIENSGTIELDGGNEIMIETTGDEIKHLNRYDVETIDGNIINYNDLPIEVVEDIEQVIEDKRVELEKEFERGRNEDW